MESTYIFYIAFQVLKVLPIKICKIQPPDLLFLFVLFTFTSGGIFHKFLDFIRRYLKKIFSSRIFLFSGFAQTPPPHPPISLHFPNTDYPAIAIDPHQPLYANLTLHNSPILFGCRTGICGTCLVAATGDMLPADADEQEVLDILAPHCPTARLACQIHATGEGDLTLTPLQQNPS